MNERFDVNSRCSLLDHLLLLGFFLSQYNYVKISNHMLAPVLCEHSTCKMKLVFNYRAQYPRLTQNAFSHQMDFVYNSRLGLINSVDRYLETLLSFSAAVVILPVTILLNNYRSPRTIPARKVCCAPVNRYAVAHERAMIEKLLIILHV